PALLTASFGVAALSPEDRSLADIIKRTDRALYASKEAGRNRTTIDRRIEAAE
ncbi:MAG: diguanylate cyclase, partial [Sphingomonadales bacterium]